MSLAATRTVELPSQWMLAVQAACEVVASTALGTACTGFHPATAPTTAGLSAYVPILEPQASIQVGIVCDDESGRGLARALLQFGPDEALSRSDVADALGEIANMVAGAAKAGMASSHVTISLGLPMVVHGWVEPSGHALLECTSTSIGGAPITLVIIRSPTSR